MSAFAAALLAPSVVHGVEGFLGTGSTHRFDALVRDVTLLVVVLMLDGAGIKFARTWFLALATFTFAADFVADATFRLMPANASLHHNWHQVQTAQNRHLLAQLLALREQARALHQP
jgi:hypothetical protein